MSADDWVCCPKCKKRIIDFINKQYGRVSVEEFRLLSRLKNLFETGHGYLNKEFNVKEMEILCNLQNKLDFEFIPATEYGDFVETVRIDHEIVLTDEGTLFVDILYSCQLCGSEWHVSKTFGKGLNNEESDENE